MILSFELSMPSNNSWNGKWTGEENFYAVTRTYTGKAQQEKAEEILEKGSFYYDFGDGWCACVSVRCVDVKEARRINKKTRGFCGYDWMIRSINDHLDIRAD